MPSPPLRSHRRSQRAPYPLDCGRGLLLHHRDEAVGRERRPRSRTPRIAAGIARLESPEPRVTRRLLRVALAVPLLAIGLGTASAAARVGPAEPLCVQAASAYHAGIVVELGNGQVVRQCVGFETSTITALAVLDGERDRVPRPQSYGGLGEAVCQIDYEPPSYTSCLPTSGSYWVFFVSRGGGAWSSSPQGVSDATVGDGDDVGFRYDPLAGADPPPASPAGTCATATPTPAPTTHADPAPDIQANAHRDRSAGRDGDARDRRPGRPPGQLRRQLSRSEPSPPSSHGTPGSRAAVTGFQDACPSPTSPLPQRSPVPSRPGWCWQPASSALSSLCSVSRGFAGDVDEPTSARRLVALRGDHRAVHREPRLPDAGAALRRSTS